MTIFSQLKTFIIKYPSTIFNILLGPISLFITIILYILLTKGSTYSERGIGEAGEGLIVLVFLFIYGIGGIFALTHTISQMNRGNLFIINFIGLLWFPILTFILLDIYL